MMPDVRLHLEKKKYDEKRKAARAYHNCIKQIKGTTFCGEKTMFSGCVSRKKPWIYYKKEDK